MGRELAREYLTYLRHRHGPIFVPNDDDIEVLEILVNEMLAEQRLACANAVTGMSIDNKAFDACIEARPEKSDE